MVRRGNAWPMMAPVLMACWVWLGCAWAQDDDRYGASREVSDASVAVRHQAIAQSAVEVAQRLAGPLTASQRSALRAAADKTVNWVRQFSYASDAAGAATVLKLRFDPAVMDRALAELGITVWRGTWPQTLVWLAVDDGAQRYVVGGDRGAAVMQAMRDRAHRRGLALRFPLMDLAEQRQIKVGDVWGGFQEPVLQASRRYGAASVLIGRMRRRGDAVEARWTHWLGAADSAAATAGGDVQAVAGRMAATVAERLAQAFKPQSGVAASVDTVRFTVTDIDNLAAYAEALRYLQGLGGVNDVRVLRVADRSVEFAARAAGGIAGLRRLVRFGQRLRAASQGPVFHYLP